MLLGLLSIRVLTCQQQHFSLFFFYLVSPFLGSRNSCFMPKVKCRKNNCLNRILLSTDTGVRKLEELLWAKQAIPEKSN